MKRLVKCGRKYLAKLSRGLAATAHGAAGLLLATTMIVATARLGMALPGQEKVSDAAPVVTQAAEAYVKRTAPEIDTTVVATRFKTTATTVKAVQTTTAAVTTMTRNLGVAERVADPGVNAGNGMKIYKHMLYGHSDQSFGAVVKTLGVGSTFTTTVDGVTATYRVVGRTVYQKDVLNSDINLRWSIYNYVGGLTLMTCGNGSNNDASQRLVLWAVRV